MSNQQQIILDESDLESYENLLGLENSRIIKEIAMNVEKRVIQKLLQTEDIEEPKFFIDCSRPIHDLCSATPV